MLNEISELSFKDDFNDSNTQVQSFTPIIKGTRLVLKLSLLSATIPFSISCIK